MYFVLVRFVEKKEKQCSPRMIYVTVWCENSDEATYVQTIVFTLRYVMRAGFEYPRVVSRCDATSLCAIHDEISTIRLIYPIVLDFCFDPTIVFQM